MSKLTIVKPSSKAEKNTKTTLETLLITRSTIESWQTPEFQRAKKINSKVEALALEIKSDDGVIPGVLTIGVLEGVRYRLDGQHRMAAALMSGLEEFYADVRFFFADTMAEMALEFVRLNSCLVTMRPDDILRGLESSYDSLRLVRQKCPFVGYDMVRRSAHSPVVSMATALRVWRGSAAEVPTSAVEAAAKLGANLTREEAEQLIVFLSICFEAWGRDHENGRLWCALNMVICAWLYRRMVVTQYSARIPRLSKEQFRRCLMSLSADANYVDWLVGRNVGERDRSPAYARIKRAFSARLSEEMGKKILMPQPAWANS